MEIPEKENIARKLIFGFGLLILIFFISGVYSLYDIRTLSKLTRTIYDHPLVVSNAALQANVSITKIHRNMKDVVLFKSPSRREQAIAAVDQQEQLVYQYLDIVRNNILGDEGKELEKESRTLFDNWRPIRNEVIALIRQEKRDEAAEITIGKGADHVAKLEKQMLALTDYARSKATSFMNSAEETYQRLWLSSIIILILVISISFLIVLFTYRGITSTANKLRKTNALLDTTGRMARVGGWEVDVETLEVTWTDETYRIHEVPIGQKPSLEEAINFFHPEDRPKLKQAIQRALNHGKRYDMEIRFVTANGNQLWTRTKCEPEIVEGKTLRLKGTFQDITERKQAEEERQKSVERFRIAQEMSPDGFTILRPVRDDQDRVIDFTWIYENEAVARMNGTDPQKVVGQRLLELFPGHQGTQFFDAYKQVAESGMPITFEDKYVGETITKPTWFRIVVVPMAENIAILNQDITERKQAEKLLIESEMRYRSLFEFMEEGFLRSDTNGNIIMANLAIAKMCGYESAEEMIGLHMSALYADPKDRERMIRNVLKQGILYNYDILLTRKDGHHFWTSSNIKIIKDEHGERIGTEGLIRDISDRKRAEQRVEHLNRVLRAIRDVNQLIVRERDPETLIREGCRLMVDNRGYASALIILKDEENRFNMWAGSGLTSSSEKLSEMLKREEKPPCCDLASDTTDTIVIDDRYSICGSCPLASEIHKSPSLCVKLSHEGSTFGYLIAALDDNDWIDEEEISLFAEMAGDFSFALSFILLGQDHQISERKRESLESQLLTAQKMEAVGNLAGGVAHDYNNMLSIIIGYAETALEKLNLEDPLYDDINEILAAGKRSADITRQLLAFARQQTTAPKVLDLNDNIEGMLKMLRRLIGEDIDLAWLPGTDLWSVKIDPSQLDQILANLCVNAKDAIAGVGKVTIETKNAVFDTEYCADHAGFVPGEYVSLTVSDTGSGIPRDMLDKIFEPFFTTKKLHQGTGLGLSTVYGIVKQNNGFISVYSEPEEGTTLRIYVPRHVGQIEEIRIETVQDILSGQGEMILLVEDDPSILKLGEKILKSLGYTVLASSNPNEAIALAKRHEDEIHLLVTDVVMPEMNGRELSEELQKQYPNLKTLFMSGYTANVIAHRGVLEDGVNFISKPLSKKELAEKVREALRGSL